MLHAGNMKKTGGRTVGSKRNRKHSADILVHVFEKLIYVLMKIQAKFSLNSIF